MEQITGAIVTGAFLGGVYVAWQLLNNVLNGKKQSRESYIEKQFCDERHRTLERFLDSKFDELKEMLRQRQ